MSLTDEVAETGQCTIDDSWTYYTAKAHPVQSACTFTKTAVGNHPWLQ